MRLAILFYAVSQVAAACTCSRLPEMCQVVSSADAIFIGRVQPGTTVGFVKFQVSEVFVGQVASQVELRNGNGMCGFPFQPGVDYVVYASHDNPRKGLATGLCAGHNARTTDAPEDLKYLRNLSKLPKHGSFTGSVGAGIPLPWAPVVLKGRGGTFRKYADHLGTFRFSDIPAGNYEYSAELPAGLLGGDPKPVRIGPGSCMSGFIEVRGRSSVSGFITDDKGKPVGDSEMLRLLYLGMPGRAAATMQVINGHFRIDGILPGRYVMEWTIHKTTVHGTVTRKSYYPGVSSEQKAAILEFDGKQDMANLQWNTGPVLETQSWQGRTVDRNGTPVTGAMISLRDVETAEVVFTGTSQTNAVFQAAGFQGRRYQLRADFHSQPDWHIHSPAIDAGKGPLRVVLSHSGRRETCERCRVRKLH